MKRSNIKAYGWKILKIVVVVAAVSFVVDTLLFQQVVEPVKFAIKTTLFSTVILLLMEWESRYKQGQRNHAGEE